MGFRKRLYQVLIVCAVLAAWDVFGKEMYYTWLQSQTEFQTPLGFGESFMGYVLVAGFAWVLSWIITRKMDNPYR